ncbi:MAG: DUF4157 domain-containing protein [Anaerolineae bacterium]
MRQKRKQTQDVEKGSKTTQKHQLGAKQKPDTSQFEASPDPYLQQTGLASDSLTPANMGQWQRAIGNQAVGRLLIQPKLTLGPIGDKYEQEAHAVAKQVVGRLSAPNQPANTPSAQRQEEEELQMKAVTAVQRQEEEDLQMKLVTAVHRQEEAGYGGGEISQDIFFRQGEYNPGNSDGQELLAHELTHVVQQNSAQAHRAQTMRVLPRLGAASVQLKANHVGNKPYATFQGEVVVLIGQLFNARENVSSVAGKLQFAFTKLKSAVDKGDINAGNAKTWVSQQFEAIHRQARAAGFDFKELKLTYDDNELSLEKKDNTLWVDGKKDPHTVTPERHQIPAPGVNLPEFLKGITEGRIAELFLTLGGLVGHVQQVQGAINQLYNAMNAGTIPQNAAAEAAQKIAAALTKAGQAASFNYGKQIFDFRGLISDLAIEKTNEGFQVNGKPF